MQLMMSRTFIITGMSLMKSDSDNNVILLFNEKDTYLGKFNRNEYRSSFKEYCAANSEIYSEINALLAENAENTCFDRISGMMIEAGDQCVKEVSKRNAASEQQKLNLFVVSYVILGFLESCPADKKDRTRDCMDYLCTSWAGHFKDSRIKAATVDELDSGFRRKLCYITTAASVALGHGDDCSELETLKDFRDSYMQENNERRNMINEYYDMAPTIVKRISRESDEKKIYSDIWNRYIVKCVEDIRTGRNDDCLNVYGIMVKELSDRYLYTFHGRQH